MSFPAEHMSEHAESAARGIRIAIIAHAGTARDACIQAVDATGAKSDAFDSPEQAHEAMVAQPFNGVMMDLETKLRSPGRDKVLDQEITLVYPTVLVKWFEQDGALRISNQGSRGRTLEEFLSHACRRFSGRVLRRGPRADRRFNVLLSADPKFSSDQVERTVTTNAGKGGCFICTTSEHWQPAAKIWMVLKELGSRAPIQGEVRWIQPWGKRMTFPGMGVRFVQVAPEQQSDVLGI